MTAELVFAASTVNDAEPYNLPLAAEAAKAWQAVAVRQAVSLNREGRYREAQKGLDEAIKRITKFVREKWRLPEAEPLLDEMRALRERIDRDLGEGNRKRISTEKWKGTRGERDHRGSRR
jgi:hypothetical protein